MPQALAGLHRVWWSIELPGYRNHPELATYSPFDYEGLPPIKEQLDAELAWLTEKPAPKGPFIDESDSDPMRAATLDELEALLPSGADRTPPAFRAFLAKQAAQHRVRSATACYLDLGEFPVEVEGGGTLIHFLSDQQWVLHWLLFVGTDDEEAVVVSYRPYGFDVPDEAPRHFDQRKHSAVCAESFSEFLYRFWIENEIWFAIEKKRELTDEQRAYAEHYPPLGAA
jgi:hypothetical protein